MAVKTLLPSTNLTWDDIRDTLNANEGSVSNEFASAFRETAKVNKWSKYKPINLDYVVDVPEYAYKNANYGFSFGQIIFGETLQYGEWTFNPPTDKFRMEDFRRYKPSATKFYLSGLNEGQTLLFSDVGDDSYFTVERIIFDTSDEYSLSIKDFNFGNPDIRLGLLVKNESTNTWTVSIADSGSNMIPATQWRTNENTDKLEAYLILCTPDFLPPANITDVSPVSGSAFPLPNGSDLYDSSEKNAYHVHIVPSAIVKKLTLKEVSSSLNGTFTPWYNFSTDNRLFTYLGAFYMKIENSTTKGFSVNLRDLKFQFSTNFYDNQSFTVQNSDGLFNVYDKNKDIINGDISIDLNPGDYIYVGSDHLLNKGYVDAPRYDNLDVTVSVYADSTSGASTFGPICVKGEN